MSVNFSLEGKIAFVTGASYGIGFAIASGMAKAGAKIVFNDIKQELVDKGLAAYKEAGIDAHGYVCDVTNEEAVNATVEKITKEVGPIDILVNNAGVVDDAYLLMLNNDSLDRSLDINVKGYFYCSQQAALKMFKQKSGRIVNVSSVSSKLALAGQSV